MEENLTGLMIFLASPDGLRDERQLFRQIVWTFNENVALKAKVVFIPVMCEQMTGGPGQAQGRINRRIEDCDYCITMFWNTLGSPSEENSPEGSKSVTDGEYKKALKLKEEGKVKQVVLFFKKIPSYQLNDPGPELNRLLEYKRQRQKDCQYIDFDDETKFEEQVKRHLFEWLVENTGAGGLKGPPTDVSEFENPESIAGSN